MSRCWLLLFVALLGCCEDAVFSYPDEHRTITAEAGQTVALPCRVTDNRPILHLYWHRPGKKEGSVLYTLGQNTTRTDPPWFEGRVELKERWVEHGDASLILKNVSTEDSGTYECKVFQGLVGCMRSRVHYLNFLMCMRRMSPEVSVTVSLSVLPGHRGGDIKRGGDKEGGDEQTGSKEGGDEERGNQEGGAEVGGNEEGGDEEGGNKEAGEKEGGNEGGGDKEELDEGGGNKGGGDKRRGDEEGGDNERGGKGGGGEPRGVQGPSSQAHVGLVVGGTAAAVTAAVVGLMIGRRRLMRSSPPRYEHQLV